MHSISSLSHYRISENGFLPSDPPLERLPNDYYQPWEDVVDELPQLLRADMIRESVDSMPTLSTSSLSTEEERRRAYLLLVLMQHAYIWGGELPSERLPPQISVPLLEVSSTLELPPVATYAAVNLWNWRPLSDISDIRQPEDLASLHTFTGSVDEEWFYLISVAMEARAASLILLMLDTAAAAEAERPSEVIAGLKDLACSLDEIGVLLDRMDERCNPNYFYHSIRPYLAGSQNMEAAGLKKGVFYDEGNGKGQWRRYRGGSNAQSSLIQFFDVVLGVEHPHTPTFHEEMRSYMPGPHAAFLKDMAKFTNLRGYVEARKSNADLRAAFNNAVLQLKRFRDKHIQLVTRYIVIPSKSSSNPREAKRLNLALASTRSRTTNEGENAELHGTGGTKLIPFLSRTRDETVMAKVV